jgi:hypothetical protein
VLDQSHVFPEGIANRAFEDRVLLWPGGIVLNKLDLAVDLLGRADRHARNLGIALITRRRFVLGLHGEPPGILANRAGNYNSCVR